MPGAARPSCGLALAQPGRLDALGRAARPGFEAKGADGEGTPLPTTPLVCTLVCRRYAPPSGGKF